VAESSVLKEELDADASAMWLRNIPRKPWALAVPTKSAARLPPSTPI
jgi:hypothetical protein